MKMSNQNGFTTRGAFKTIVVVALSVILVACGGKRKTTDSSGEPIVDMTRPPVMIKDIQEQTVESNPNEVISYEKWRQERAKDQAQDAAEEAETPPDPE